MDGWTERLTDRQTDRQIFKGAEETPSGELLAKCRKTPRERPPRHAQNGHSITHLPHLQSFLHYFVVISQTHRLVSQERLSPRVGTSVFIDLIPITPAGEQWF